ncbi:MAG: hypothetical protein ACFE9D_02930 [Promethearchaeota archaeon]
MSRRQRKQKKTKQKKRLESIPEKLQRKRDRQVRQRSRRTPRWVQYGLVVVLIAIIIGGFAWFWWINLPPIEPPEPLQGDVDILQQDIFYVYINDTGQIQIDYMLGRFAGGTFGGDQPLNVSFTRDFDRGQVNFTLRDPYVFYDYYGNAYYIPSEVGADSLAFIVDNIQPNKQNTFEEYALRGGTYMKGYWSLFWTYIINSSDNNWLRNDNLDSMFTFTFDIHPENDTLPENTPTIVHCNITFNTLSASDANVYNFGESRIIFPKQIYNDTTLLANITLQEIFRIGSADSGFESYTTNNETHIGFQANPISVAMSQNQTWGYIFDLNVTTFTNETFCLLDLTSPVNEFFMQTGYTGSVEEQPMHFPKSEISIDTPKLANKNQNVTDILIRFPAIYVDNETIAYQVTPASFGPQSYPITPPMNREPESRTVIGLEGIKTNLRELGLEPVTLFTESRRVIHIRYDNISHASLDERSVG